MKTQVEMFFFAKVTGNKIIIDTKINKTNNLLFIAECFVNIYELIFAL